MTEFTAIQTKVCEDIIERMGQAQNRNNEADFLLEKSKLLDVLTIIKAAAPSTYTKYFKFGEVEFHTD